MLIQFCSFSQNLIPNPSFELYDTCPDYIGQIERATQWLNAGNTPDYYNSCSATPAYGVPGAGGGFQFARTGNAYAGIVGSYFMGVQREYIQVKLTDTLLVNNCYVVSFYANILNRSIYASNNLSLVFSDTSFVNSTFGAYNLQGGIKKFLNPRLSDTLNWIEVRGVYTALGNESFASLGNFKSDIETDTITTNPWPDGTYNGTYYLIDDVSVISIDSILGGMPANAGNDVTIIGGDSVFIGQAITNLNCNWYIGATLIADSVSGIFVSPTATTTYIVEQNLCGTITYDTVTVYVSGVGINENHWSSKINLYPNPNEGEFKIEFIGLEKNYVLIEIIDIMGRIVYTENLQLINGMSNIKLDNGSGVYSVRITNFHTNEHIVKRVVIQK